MVEEPYRSKGVGDNMAALFTKIGELIAKYVVKYVVRFLIDHITAWVERRRISQEHDKKEETAKPAYDQAVKEGTHEDIVKATEDRFRG